MTGKLLKEYVDRIGLVTSAELSQRTGVEKDVWFQAAVPLVLDKEIFLCRLVHGKETLISRHLLYCMRSVYNEPELTGGAQDLLDWLSDHEPADGQAIARAEAVPEDEAADAMRELQQKLCVAPGALAGDTSTPDGSREELEQAVHFSWVTIETWLDKLYRPVRYNELAYCVSELKHILSKHFTSREITSLIYHGKL